MCYNQYDSMNFKPKIAECGHSICMHCITKLKKCCLCNYPFSTERSSFFNRRTEYSSNPYLINLPRGEPRAQFKDNYALLDMLEKQSKDYEVCRLSSQPEDFYCLECGITVCNTCIDENHSDHKFTRISHKMFSIAKSLQIKVEEAQTKIKENGQLKQKIEKAEAKNKELESEAPRIIDRLFERIIVMICNARDHVKECLQSDLTQKQELIQRVYSSIQDMTDSLTQLQSQMVDLSEDIQQGNFIKNMQHIDRFDKLEAELIPLHKEVTLTAAEHSSAQYEASSMHDKLELVVKELGRLLPGYKKYGSTNPFESIPAVQLFPDESLNLDTMNNRSHTDVINDRSISYPSGSRLAIRRDPDDEDYRVQSRFSRFQFNDPLDTILGREFDFYEYLGRQRRNRIDNLS